MPSENTQASLTALDQKIVSVFPTCVVRKDLIKEVRGNAVVPSFVLEYLLGQYCTTSDEDGIKAGIENVKQILSRHYVHKSEAELVRSNIRERGHQKIIDKVSVVLNEKADKYEASFFNLGISKVIVGPDLIKKNPKLLVSGIWCICDIGYLFDEDEKTVPWILNSLKPIQMSRSDLEGFREGRKSFSFDEWVDLLMQSLGLNPEYFSKRGKLIQLTRLIPFCERNYNLMELGPKGTGKSHVYSEFSPHGILLSGGEVTVPKLFVNNSNGKIGLVGFWDLVAFDEFAGKEKRVDKALVDIMKNYMANKTFSRGSQTVGAEASMVFVGNTSHTVPYMLKTADLFCDLPDKYHDSAFLDRIHCYNPGWEVDNLRQEMFTSGYGFVVDYLAEILKSLRNEDFSSAYDKYFTLGDEISARDRDGIRKTFSGLMKILFPNGDPSSDECRELLEFAIEGRRRVKDQLMRIDDTFNRTSFEYEQKDNGKKFEVKTQEELNFPDFYNQVQPEKTSSDESADQTSKADSNSAEKSVNAKSDLKDNADSAPVSEKETLKAPEIKLEPHQDVISESQRGFSFYDEIMPYLKGAKKITAVDPYIRMFFQQRNFMEFLVGLVKFNWPENEIEVELTTCQDEVNPDKQNENFKEMADSLERYGVKFTWQYAQSGIHARYIVTDTGWKISLDRGFDIYQRTELGAFSVESYLPQLRACKRFEITFLKVGK